MMQDNITQDEIDAILKSAASASNAEDNVLDPGSPSQALKSPPVKPGGTRGSEQRGKTGAENVQKDQNPADDTAASSSQNPAPDVEAAHAQSTQEPATDQQREALNPKGEAADLGSPSARNSESPEGFSIKDRSNIDFLLDVPLDVSVELGRTKIDVKDMIQLIPGSVIELDRLIGEPVDLLVNDRLIARGEVVVFDENFGVRITDIIKSEDRIKSLR